jgi:MerR family transcriptional regulator, light-induced transcriptional regulator
MIERTYRIHIASEMSGVSEGLIRAWERRYGVLKPKRTASGYRAYTERDIEVLKRLKKLTEEGVAIAEAVKLLPQIKREARESKELDEVFSVRVPVAQQYARWRDDILRAAERMDQQAVEKVLDEAMAAVPPVSLFEEVVAPVQREIGERWHRGQVDIAQEHLVTMAVRQRVMTLLQQAPRRARKHVICACFPLEEHEMGVLGVALRFRHAGWRVTCLGAKTPIELLQRMVHAVVPDVVALSTVNDMGPDIFVGAITSAVALLTAKTKLVVGGVVALKYHHLASSAGVQVVTSEADWKLLLA